MYLSCLCRLQHCLSYIHSDLTVSCNSTSIRSEIHAQCVRYCYTMVDLQASTMLVQQLIATVELQATDMQKVHSVLHNLNRTPIADSANSVDTEVYFTSVPPTHENRNRVAPLSTLRKLGKDIPLLMETSHLSWKAHMLS